MEKEHPLEEVIKELVDRKIPGDTVAAFFDAVSRLNRPPPLVMPPEVEGLSATERQIWRARQEFLRKKGRGAEAR